MSMRRIALGVSVNAFSFASNLALQLLSVPILIGSWGLATFGSWLLLSSVPSYLAMGNLGFSAVASHDMAALLAGGRVTESRRIFHTAWMTILGLTGSVLVLGLLAAAMVPVDGLTSTIAMPPGDLRLAIAALVIYSFAVLQSDVIMNGYRAVGEYPRGSMVSALTQLAERGGIMVAALLGHGLLVATVVMMAVRLVAAVAMYVDYCRRHPDLRPGFADASRAEFRRQAHLAFGVMLFPLGTALNLQGPLLVLGALFSPAVVGLFGATRTLTRFALQATNIVSTALMADFAMAQGRQDAGATRRIFAFNLLSGAVLLAVAFVGLTLLGQPFARIWTGGKAVPGVTMLIALSLAAVLQGMWLLTANLLLASNRQYAYTPAFVAVSVAMLALMIPAGRAAGPVGVAAVLCIAECTMLLWVQRQARRCGIGTLADVPPFAGEALVFLRERFGRVLSRGAS